MAKTIEDRLERLEEDTIETSKTIAELVQYRELVSHAAVDRVTSLEAFKQTAERTMAEVRGGFKTAVAIGGILMALLTLAVSILALRGG